MEFDATYLALLQEELEDAERRKNQADPEGLPILNRQIREIARDIRRYSMKSEDSVSYETQGDMTRVVE